MLSKILTRIPSKSIHFPPLKELQRVQEVEKMAGQQNGVESGGCEVGVVKRKAGVVRNDWRGAKIGRGPPEKNSRGL